MKGIILTSFTVYVIGFFISLVTLGLTILEGEKFRTAILINALYPIWLTFGTIFIIAVFVRAFIKNETIEDSWDILREKLYESKFWKSI